MASGFEAYERLRAVGTLPALVDRAAGLWPDRTAFIFDESGERLTFADVARRSNAIANALTALGVGHGDRVAVMQPNRPEFPLSWFGITRIGAIMVPINVFYREADAGYLLAHSEAKAILVDLRFLPLIRSIRDRMPALRHVVVVGGADPPSPKRSSGSAQAGGERRLDALLADADDGRPAVTVLPEHLANIQYTSGTTGRPKGCMLSHLFWLEMGAKIGTVDAARLDDSSVMLTAQPYYYIDPQWNTVVMLCHGATLIVLDRFHPSSFWQKVRDYDVTFFYCLGAMPTLMLKMPPHADDRNHKVKAVICSAIPVGQHREIEARFGVPWYEAFGMTESGGDLAVSIEDHDELVGTGSIGSPTPGREVRIVDDEDRPLPRGEVGEIVFRGTGFMDGYYKNPEATAEIFRNGWLHTGDLGLMDAKGRITYVGRKKDMIRRSGENISAVEVEETLARHPAIRLAACVPVPDDVRGEEVKAYIVLQPGIEPARTLPKELAAWCAGKLAYFKVPRYWTFLDDLPRTPSERVMKAELTKGEVDLRIGAYDRIDDTWR